MRKTSTLFQDNPVHLSGDWRRLLDTRNRLKRKRSGGYLGILVWVFSKKSNGGVFLSWSPFPEYSPGWMDFLSLASLHVLQSSATSICHFPHPNL